MLWMTSPGLSTSVCGIIGSLSRSVYSWMSRSFWTIRSGSERNGHCAPTHPPHPRTRRAARRAELLERVVRVGRDRGDLGVAHGDLRIERGELEVLLVLLRAVVP